MSDTKPSHEELMRILGKFNHNAMPEKSKKKYDDREIEIVRRIIFKAAQKAKLKIKEKKND